MRATLGAPLGRTCSVRAWERDSRRLQWAPCWKSLQGIAAGLARRARLERVPGAALLTLQVSENPIDDLGIGDERSYLHLGATATEEGVHLENLLDQARPRCPASLNELRGGIGRCTPACRRLGLLL